MYSLLTWSWIFPLSCCWLYANCKTGPNTGNILSPFKPLWPTTWICIVWLCSPGFEPGTVMGIVNI